MTVQLEISSFFIGVTRIKPHWDLNMVCLDIKSYLTSKKSLILPATLGLIPPCCNVTCITVLYQIFCFM